jgi:putative flippase GtrA
LSRLLGSSAARPLRFGLLAVFTSTGLDSVIAYAIALALAVQFNFVFSQLLVWHDRPKSLTLGRVVHRWATFHAFTGVSIVVNFVAFVLARPYMPDIAAAIVALGASTVIKFLSLDRLVFRPSGVR